MKMMRKELALFDIIYQRSTLDVCLKGKVRDSHAKDSEEDDEVEVEYC